MKDYALPYYTSLWWARLFLLGSFVSLIFAVFSGQFFDIYKHLLLGFVLFYIIAVQHATITFPRNKGGIFKISSDLSFVLMFLGYVFWLLPLFKLGFLLFLVFQLLPLIHYRLKTPRKVYDRVSYIFMGVAMVGGLISLFISSWKPFIHATFLGFELNMFLGCMAWMLPRFSKNTEDISPVIYASIVSSVISLALNLYGFITVRYIFLRFAAIFMILSLAIFWFLFFKKFFTWHLHLPFLYFVIGFVFAYMINLHWHPRFVLSAMTLFAIVMGSKWYPLIFVNVPQKPNWVFNMAFVSLLISPFFYHIYRVFAVVFIIWIAIEGIKSKFLLNETKQTLLYYLGKN